jgi:hypothetical protein
VVSHMQTSASHVGGHDGGGKCAEDSLQP